MQFRDLHVLRDLRLLPAAATVESTQRTTYQIHHSMSALAIWHRSRSTIMLLTDISKKAPWKSVTRVCGTDRRN